MGNLTIRNMTIRIMTALLAGSYYGLSYFRWLDFFLLEEKSKHLKYDYPYNDSASRAVIIRKVMFLKLRLLA